MVQAVEHQGFSFVDVLQPCVSFNNTYKRYNALVEILDHVPDSYEDLLDPKWKGQIGITRSVYAWTTLALAEGGWGIEKTETFLRKLGKQDLIWARGHTAGHTLLIAGEFKLFAEELVYHAFLSRDKGAPVDWVRVNPVVVVGTSFTFQKMAAHPNAAKLFIDTYTKACLPKRTKFYQKTRALYSLIYKEVM